MRPRYLFMILLVLAELLSGCSAIDVNALPDGYNREENPDCTSSYTAPIVDGVTTLALLTMAVIFAHRAKGASDDVGWVVPFSDRDVEEFGCGMALLTAIPYGIYTFIGGSRVHKCNQAKDNYGKWMVGPERMRMLEYEIKMGRDLLNRKTEQEQESMDKQPNGDKKDVDNVESPAW